MVQRSFVPRLLILQLSGIFLLLSCGSVRAPLRIRVHVAPGFAGTMRLAACVSGAPADEIAVDAQGMANTSACPGPDRSVTVVVVEGSREYTAAPGDVSIPRTGDGIATSIEARIRP